MGHARHGTAILSAIVITVTSIALAVPPASADEGAADAWPDLSDGVQEAPTVEEAADVIGSEMAEKLRRDTLVSLNGMMTRKLGNLDSQGQAALGQSDYFTEADVAVYVVAQADGPAPTGTDFSAIGVPIHVTVMEDGNTTVPDPSDDGASYGYSPSTAWGSETYSTGVAWDINDGGATCNTTIAKNELIVTKRRLNDTSSTYNYYGLVGIGVADLTQSASNCDDYLDWASIGLWSTSPSAIYSVKQPTSDYSSGCTDRTFTVTGPLGGVNFSMTSTGRQCEIWDVKNGGAFYANAHYDIWYDNNSKCGAHTRDMVQETVVRYTAGNGLGLGIGYGVNAGNMNHTLEWLDCRGS